MAVKSKLMPKARRRVAASRFGSLNAVIADPVKKAPRAKGDPEDFSKTLARATEVLGDRDSAFRWLGTPVPGLDYETPVAVLRTPQGVIRVNDILTQMEHGVW